jgi:TRAP-type C4-dicarboxylate transport system permease small subunit
MTAWMIRHPRQASALIWASGVVLVLLIEILFPYGSGNRVNWTEAVALALIISSVGIVGVALGLRERGRQSGTDLKP